MHNFFCILMISTQVVVVGGQTTLHSGRSTTAALARYYRRWYCQTPCASNHSIFFFNSANMVSDSGINCFAFPGEGGWSNWEPDESKGSWRASATSTRAAATISRWLFWPYFVDSACFDVSAEKNWISQYLLSPPAGAGQPQYGGAPAGGGYPPQPQGYYQPQPQPQQARKMLISVYAAASPSHNKQLCCSS